MLSDLAATFQIVVVDWSCHFAWNYEEDESEAKTGEHRYPAMGVPDMKRFNQQFARAGVARALRSIMPRRSPSVAHLTRGMIFVLAILLSSHGSGHAQRGVGPFERLAGQWTGSGTIDLSNGAREPIRCRAGYDVLAARRNLQINIRCASDSFNFNLYSSAVLSGRAVSGTWSESTHGIAGTISGTAEGDHIHVRAESLAFTANLSLATHGSRQSVLIRAVDPNASIKGATIALRRHR